MSAEPVRKKRGRPSHKPTPRLRRKVSIWKAGGMTNEQIAAVLRIDSDTLVKHYSDDLNTGACDRRSEVLEALFRQAKKGNVSAVKTVIAMNPDLSAILPSPVRAKAADQKPVKEASKGKKEQANDDATTAAVGTEWADLLKPSARPQ